jgi:hypothetical protein
MDGIFYKGTIKETYTDHIIVDIPEIMIELNKR